MFSILLAAVAAAGTCGTTFKTFYGTEISNRETNTLGFKVSSNCDFFL